MLFTQEENASIYLQMHPKLNETSPLSWWLKITERKFCFKIPKQTWNIKYYT